MQGKASRNRIETAVIPVQDNQVRTRVGAPESKAARPRARRVSHVLRKCSRRNSRLAMKRLISTFHRVHAWLKVIEVENLCKGFGDRMLINNLSFSVPRGSIVGIIGGNGAGKTTFLRMLVGQEQPDSGSITLGETVDLAYVDQSRDTLNDNNTVWQEISDGAENMMIGSYEVASRAYVGPFQLQRQRPSKIHSGFIGWRTQPRTFVQITQRGANVLLLDEPTNDLDVETLRALKKGARIPGTVIVVSHDRWFLDRIATHILAFEGDSEVIWHEGNYTDYEADRKNVWVIMSRPESNTRNCLTANRNRDLN